MLAGLARRSDWPAWGGHRPSQRVRRGRRLGPVQLVARGARVGPPPSLGQWVDRAWSSWQARVCEPPLAGRRMAQAAHLRGVPPRAPRLKAPFLRGVPPRAPRLKAPPLSADIASGPCCGIAHIPRVDSCSARWPPGVPWKRIHSTPSSKSPPSRQPTALCAVRGREPSVCYALDPSVHTRLGVVPRSEGVPPSIGPLQFALNREVEDSFHGGGKSSANKIRSSGNRHEVIKLRR